MREIDLSPEVEPIEWLLWLTYHSRSAPDTSCEIALEPDQWQVLYAKIHGQIYPDNRPPPTLQEVIRWIAWGRSRCHTEGDRPCFLAISKRSGEASALFYPSILSTHSIF